MALEAFWALLNQEVSEVTGVQVPVHAGGRHTPSVLARVSRVSRVSSNDPGGMGTALPVGADTPDTPPESVRYLAQPARALGCTPDTSVTPNKIKVDLTATETSAFFVQPEPKRLFRKRGPCLTDSEQLASGEYYAHHFGCQICIAAGRSSAAGERCTLGLVLWNGYNGTNG